MTRIIDFADGFSTDTTPTITQDIEVDTLILPNQDQDEFLTVDGTGEVVSSGYVGAMIDDKINQNLVINGNFDFWQRGTTTTTSGAFCADRWQSSATGSTFTTSQQATAGTEAFNASYFHRTVVTTVAGASNFMYVRHLFESVRLTAGMPITLTFYAKADSSKNMSIEFRQFFGTGGSPSASVTQQGVNKLALTSSWQKFTVTTTLGTMSGKTLGTNGDDCMQILFWYDAGSSFNGNTSTLGQQSGTFDIAFVKLEYGSYATDFCLSGGDLGGEFFKCQRFYQKSYAPTTNPASSTASGQVHVTVRAAGTSSTNTASWAFNQSMRTIPTVVVYPRDGANAGDVGVNTAGSGAGEATASVAVYRNSIRLDVPSTSGLTLGDAVFLTFHYTADAEL